MSGKHVETLFEADEIYKRGVEDGVRKSLLALINAPIKKTQFARGVVCKTLMKEQAKNKGLKP